MNFKLLAIFFFACKNLHEEIVDKSELNKIYIMIQCSYM